MAQQGNPKSSPATSSVNPTHTDALASVRREFSDGLEQESKNELEKAKNTYLKVGEFIQAYFASKFFSFLFLK